MGYGGGDDGGLQGAQDPSVRPNVWTYNNVLAALIRRGRLDEALGVWASLKQQAAQEQQQGGGVRADVVTVNTLLDGLLSAEPPRVREAELLFMEMVEGGTQPDEYTFSILLKAYGPEDAAPEDARKSGPNRLLDMVMLNRDISLDTTAVNTLLFALMRTGDWKRSIVFFDDFKAGRSVGRSQPLHLPRLPRPDHAAPVPSLSWCVAVCRQHDPRRARHPGRDHVHHPDQGRGRLAQHVLGRQDHAALPRNAPPLPDPTRPADRQRHRQLARQVQVRRRWVGGQGTRVYYVYVWR